jgi:hypothetical protein
MAFRTEPYGPSAPGPGALATTTLVLARAATVFPAAIPATGLLFVALSATSFAGALAMLGFGGYPVLIFPMLFLPPLILALLDSAGLYMPLLVALAHIVGFVICSLRK